MKNAEGVDSVVSARQLASDMYRRWFAAVGVSLPENADQLIEVSPLVGATLEQFVAQWDDRVSSITGPYYMEEKDSN